MDGPFRQVFGLGSVPGKRLPRRLGHGFPPAAPGGGIGQCLVRAWRTLWRSFSVTAARQSRICTGFPLAMPELGRPEQGHS